MNDDKIEQPDTGFIEAYGQVSMDDNTQYPRGGRPEFIHVDEVPTTRVNLTELTRTKNYTVEDDDGYID